MKINKNIIFTKEKEKLNLFVLSDLHIYDNRSLKKLKKIKTFLNNKEYDVICLVGDIIDSTNILDKNNKIYQELINFIQFLGTKAKTYIVYGNHDVSSYNYKLRKRKDDINRFYDVLAKDLKSIKNIKLLDNQVVQLKEGYTISGFNPRINYDYKNGEDEFFYENIDFTKKINPKNFNILLCHYPNVINELINERKIKNIDVGISGHNHNGMTQLKFFPVETILNIFNQKNRGIITPKKSFKLSKTKFLRGKMKLNDKTTLIINPAVTSLSNCAGFLHKFDNLFYCGATEINFIPEKGLDN